jgi:hypothetical protein
MDYSYKHQIFLFYLLLSSVEDWAESAESRFRKRTWIVESLVLVQPTDPLHVCVANIEVED